jgi:LysM repeat protein
MKMRQKTWVWLLGGTVLIGGMMLMAVLLGVLALWSMAGPRVAAGVTVNDVALAGMTQTRVEATLAGQLKNRQLSAVDGLDGTRRWVTTLEDMGVRYDIAATVAAVMSAPRDTQVQPRYSVDLTRAQLGLVGLSDMSNITALPPDGDFLGQEGRMLDIPVVLDRLRVNVGAEIGDGELTLPMFTLPIPEPPPAPTFAESYNGPVVQHTVERGQELGLIARGYNVSLTDIVALNGIENPDLLYIGQVLQIPAASVYQPAADDAPPAPTNSGRAFVISVSTQRIYAYENGALVRSQLVSTGLPETPTVLGDYKVYVKYTADDMQGADYFLPAVPWTMYFYQGYAIHGAYWHNSFGRPMSHGCVNLPVAEAEWFFNFASVGTPVRVIG